ncbi:hypothetical protein [Devosia sp. A369]
MPPYLWTTDDDEVALDAVTVGIGFDSTALLAADLQAELHTAKVYWPERNYQGEKIHARSEGPFDPPVALSYAEIIAERYGFTRVVVSIQNRDLWHDSWGELREQEGFD